MLGLLFQDPAKGQVRYFHLFWLGAQNEELSVHADESKCRSTAH